MNRTQVGRAGGRTAAALRPARPADLAALRDFFAGLSAQTRYLRFFAPVTPSPALLHLLSGGTGPTYAVVATRGDAIIGHAMAADRAGLRGARTTDIGVVVADAWQGQGVGSALVRALISRAQARGVTSLTMDVLPDNRQMLAMIAAHWTVARRHRSADCVTIQVTLPVPVAPLTRPSHARSSRAKRRTSTSATARATTTPALTASSVMVRATGT